MTTETKMPEPSAYLYTTPRGGRAVDLKCFDLNTPDVTRQDLITTTQAQAYADARVREALEQAAKAVIKELYPTNPLHDWTGVAHDHAKMAVLAEQAIRALIPPTNPPA